MNKTKLFFHFCQEDVASLIVFGIPSSVHLNLHERNLLYSNDFLTKIEFCGIVTRSSGNMRSFPTGFDLEW